MMREPTVRQEHGAARTKALWEAHGGAGRGGRRRVMDKEVVKQ